MQESCPARSEVLRYLSGDFKSVVPSGLLQHLQFCPRCIELLGSLQRPDKALTGCLNSETFDPIQDEHELTRPDLFGSQSKTIEIDDAVHESLKFSNYRVLGVIGRGGMGLVLKAEQLATQRIVALKIIDPTLLRFYSPAKLRVQRARFQAEIAAAANIDHANVVIVFEGGEDAGRQFCAMQLIEGSSLHELVVAGLDAREAADYVRQAAIGVAEAHRMGIIHRDIKPQNILIDGRNQVAKVSDFGLAKFVRADTDADRLTVSENLFGTLDFMSPEQLTETASANEKSDIYSLGATLYFCLTGRTPFRKQNICLQVRQIMEQDPVEPAFLVPGLHPDLNAICMKCLEKNPAARFSSANELADDLQRFFDHLPTTAKPPSVRNRLRKFCRRNVVASIFSAVIGIMLLIGFVSAIAFHRNTVELNRQLKASNASLITINDSYLDANRRLEASIEQELALRKKTEEAVTIGQESVKKFLLDIATSPQMFGSHDKTQLVRKRLLNLAKQQFDELGGLHQTPQLQYYSILSQLNAAQIAMQLGEFETASQQFKKIAARCEQLSPVMSDVSLVDELKGNVYYAHGLLSLKKKNPQLAMMKLESALKIYERLAEDKKNDLEMDGRRVSVVSMLSVSLVQTRQFGKAAKLLMVYEPFVDMVEQKLVSHDWGASSSDTKSRIVASYLQYHWVKWSVQNKLGTPQSLTSLQQRFAYVERMQFEDSPPAFKQVLGGFYMQIGNINQRTNPTDSKRYLEKSVEIFSKLHADHDAVTDYQYSYAISLSYLASVCSDIKQHAESSIHLTKADKLISDLLAKAPNSEKYLLGKSRISSAWSAHWSSQQEHSKSLEYLQVTTRTYRRLNEIAPNSGTYVGLLSESYSNISKELLTREKYAGSFSALVKAVKTEENPSHAAKLVRDYFKRLCRRWFGLVILKVFANRT